MKSAESPIMREEIEEQEQLDLLLKEHNYLKQHFPKCVLSIGCHYIIRQWMSSLINRYGKHWIS